MPAPEAGLTVFETFDGSAVVSLALEEEMLTIAASGRPALSVASWHGPVVILGHGQPEADVRLEACRAHGIPVLRRITGGTGVIHARDLAISLALASSHPWAASIGSLYDRFLNVLAGALAPSGATIERPLPRHAQHRRRSPVCFEDQLADTLTVDGRKAVGCAQARRKDSVLIHAAILLHLDAALYETVFGTGVRRIEAALAPLAPGLEPCELGSAVAHAFAAALAMETTVAVPPTIDARFLERYRHRRWAPVPEAVPSASGNGWTPRHVTIKTET